MLNKDGFLRMFKRVQILVAVKLSPQRRKFVLLPFLGSKDKKFVAQMDIH